MTQPQALLFDLGGVLIDIDFARSITVWAPHSSLSLDELRQRLAFDLQYQMQERGEMTAAAYFDHLASVLQLTATHEQIEAGWNAIFAGEIAQTRAMVQAVRAQVPCYAFTNTNASHMATWTVLFPEVVRCFDRIFASHQIGLRKPEPAAFAHIAQAIDVHPNAITFFDDLLENVQAAQRAGLQAVHVRSPEDVRAALAAYGYKLQPLQPAPGS